MDFRTFIDDGCHPRFLLWYCGLFSVCRLFFSFVTGGAIINHLRFKHGYDNVQGFLGAKFGATGEGMYNFVVILRLLSEVFANLIVVGEIFGLKGSFENFT